VKEVLEWAPGLEASVAIFSRLAPNQSDRTLAALFSELLLNAVAAVAPPTPSVGFSRRLAGTGATRCGGFSRRLVANPRD
jgi:hypothetical protein